MSACLTIARKELRDHARDVRSLVTAGGLLLMGPAVVALVARSPLAAREQGAFVLLAMASVFALVAAMTGAMYVAMDATAGERERRSLVPLRLCPVSPFELALGKWLAASVFSLVGLALTLGALAWVLGAGRMAIVAQMLVALAPLAILAAAVHLLLAARCRTTKEANAWLQGLVFAPMAVSMFVVFFPAALGDWALLVPVVGQQRVISLGIAGEARPAGPALLLTAVTLGTTLPVLLLTGRALGRDDVLDG
jgi:sodium transport system permease protein